MNKNVFYNLLEKPAAVDSNNQRSLQFVISEFPWFTTARILSLKALHNEEHFGYPSELKLTSLYAHDRKKLFELIHTNSNLLFDQEPADDQSQTLFAELPFVNSIKQEQQVEEITQQPLAEMVEPIKEIEEVKEEIEVEIPAEIDLKTIIENRLKELSLTSNETVAEEDEIIISPEILEDSTEIIDNNNSNSKIIEESFESEQPIIPISEKEKEFSELELEIEKSAVEAELILEVLNLPETIKEKAIVEEQPTVEIPLEIFEEEKLPVDSIPSEIGIEKEETPIQPGTSGAYSFNQWMQLIKGKQAIEKQEGKKSELPTRLIEDEIQSPKKEIDLVETVKNERVSTKQDADLINKFLIEDPRIEIRKQEFYSPNNMARKGLEMHDDLVSETLAAIYSKQGLHEKAIFAYEKLILKYPKKNIFFAARIKEIKALINSK